MTLPGCSNTSLFRDDSGRIVPGSVAEFDRIKMSDGLEELVLIRALSTTAPVLIYVHGGPGSSELVPFRYYCSELERHFVVVNWEQRGSGRLFDAGRIPTPLTIERHVQDLRELVAWVSKRFSGRRPSLVCHSWGTYLGMVYALRYPQTIDRYIGSGQSVTPTVSERMSRQTLMGMAAKDSRDGKTALKALSRLDEGSPYGDPSDPFVIEKVKNERQWNLRYGGEIYGSQDYGLMTKAFFGTSEYTVFDFLRFGLASDYSLKALWRDYLATDLTKEVLDFPIPIFILQGRHDLTTNASLVQPFFDKIKAPVKELVWFENSSHLPMYEESSRWCAEVERVMAIR